MKWYLISSVAPNGRIYTDLIALKKKELLKYFERNKVTSITKLSKKQAYKLDEYYQRGRVYSE